MTSFRNRAVLLILLAGASWNLRVAVGVKSRIVAEYEAVQYEEGLYRARLFGHKVVVKRRV